MGNISIDDLANEITNAVREYTEDVSEAIAEKVESVSDDVLKDTIANAPKDTGKYAKGFKKSKFDGQGFTKRTIWNKKYYRIVHLNEYGHAIKGGGRVSGKPHLRPSYDQHAASLPDDIKRIIKNGGGQ